MKLKGYYNLYKDNAKIASVTKFIYKLVVILKINYFTQIQTVAQNKQT